jgi:integrase/recombinase XerD
VKKAAMRAGIKTNTDDGYSKVSPHWFRHAHASHALQKGANLELVRETLGHDSIETTKMYLHARPDRSSGYFVDDGPDFQKDD